VPALIRRLPGVFLVILALIGLILSAFSIWGIIQIQEMLVPKIESGLDLVDEALVTTEQALDVLDSTINTVSNNILRMREALVTLAQSVHDAVPILESLSTITGETIPETITATQASLTTAQTTAKTIEDILGLISRFPLMPGDPYNPKVPLNIALGQVVADLDKISPQMLTIEQNLKDSKKNLYSLEADILQVALDLIHINTELTAATEVIDQYRLLIDQVQLRLESVRAQLPNWVSTIAAFFLFLLAWIVIYQVDLLIRGIRLIRLER
jgi:hypothetical protein